jgi:tetratricopeptide (TPR) repeat protein
MTTNTIFASEQTLEEAHQAGRRHERSQAEALYKRAIEERTKAVGSGDASVGEFMHHLGRFYYQINNFQGAEETLKKSLEVLEKAYYPGHAALAPVLDDLCDVYLKQQKYAEAEPVLTRLLEVVDKTMSGDHRYVFDSLHRLAFVQRKLGKHAEAEKLLVKALKTIDTPLGPVEEFRLDLALVYQELGKNDEAETNFKQSIVGFEQRKNLPRLADALFVYSSFLRSQGRNELAKKAEELSQKVHASAGTTRPSHDIFPSTLLRA